MSDLSISPIIALTPIQWVMIAVGGFFVLIIAGILMKFFSLWLQALLSNASVSFTSLIGMQLRKVSPAVIVINRITAKKAGIELTTNQLEAHYLAGGKVPRVVQAMIAADKAKIDLEWENATAIDLAGRDILTAVQTSVDPRVIDCPSQDTNKSTIAAVAQDGIQLRAKARVTVRTNIARLVGGATEDAEGAATTTAGFSGTVTAGRGGSDGAEGSIS